MSTKDAQHTRIQVIRKATRPYNSVSVCAIGVDEEMIYRSELAFWIDGNDAGIKDVVSICSLQP